MRGTATRIEQTTDDYDATGIRTSGVGWVQRSETHRLRGGFNELRMTDVVGLLAAS